MVEANSHLKLLSASIFDIYKVFEHIDMLSIGIRYHLYTVIHPTGSDFGVLGCIWSQNDVIMSWLRLIATSNYFLHLTNTYAKCFSIAIDLRSIGIQEQFYTVIHTTCTWLRLRLWGSGSHVE